MLRSTLAGIAAAGVAAFVAADAPREWIEATGHRVVRLSEQAGTASLYFHQNPYTASGDKMVVSTPQGLATITLGMRAVKPLVEGRVSTPRVLGEVARHPGSIPGLVRLGHNSKKAAESLATFLDSYVKRLAMNSNPSTESREPRIVGAAY